MRFLVAITCSSGPKELDALALSLRAHPPMPAFSNWMLVWRSDCDGDQFQSVYS
jgi:hypothetical protein